MNCRGNETRKRIITEYIVEPKAHLKLLANQRKIVMLKQLLKMNIIFLLLLEKEMVKKKLSSVEWELQEIS